MENENDYIDNLYSNKFEKFEFQTSGDDWNAMSSKLGKLNFLKFSYVTFNVYFLGALLVVVGLAVYFGLTSINQSRKIENIENKIEVFNDKEGKTLKPLIDDSVTTQKYRKIEESSNEIKTPHKINEDEKPPSIDENKVNNTAILPETNSKKETIQVKPDSSSILKTEPKKIIRVKKTVFIKKDTVIVTDTVRIKKKLK